MELAKYLGRRRSGYKRIDGSGHGSRRRRVVFFSNGSGDRRRRFWRVRRPKIVGILKLVTAPKRFLMWLRDAYVKMMLGFAQSSVVTGGYGSGSAFGNGIGKPPLKEYDEKMIIEMYDDKIIEIYKSILKARGQVMVPRDAGKIVSCLSPVKE